MVTAIRARQTRDTAANRFEPPRELSAAPVDRRLVVGRRFEGDERLDRLEQPRALAAAEIPEVV